jgi:2,3-bisphosphoglycerate-independent phosphoglycerate mutase
VGAAAGLHVYLPGDSQAARLADPSGRLVRVEAEAIATRLSEADEIQRIRATTLEALRKFELVVAHFSYPDDHAHQGDTAGKVKSIELIDKHFFKPLAKELEPAAETRITVVPTLMCRIETRQHDERPVPFLMWGPGVESRFSLTLTEANAETTGIRVDDGTRLIDYMMHGL